MSEIAPASQASPTSTWHMYRAMVGVGVACGLLIVGVFQATRPIIERNKAEALKAAIFDVLPAASSTTTYVYREPDGFQAAEGEATGTSKVYAGYDDRGSLVGVAVEAEGMGYQDVIRVIYGYSVEQEAIVGLHVLESKETPGLGDKIETDPAFLENFERLDVSLSEDQSALAHRIVTVRSGEKKHPWEVDGITGATISSVAIGNILDRSAGIWAPRIQRGVQDLRGGE